MRVLWMSRHDPLPSQIAALKRLYGEDTEVVKDPRPFASAEEIADRYRAGGYDDLVVVAPLSVLGKLCELGLKPLWAEMEAVSPEEAEVEAAGRYYRFVRFRRVKRLVLEFEEVQPQHGGGPREG